MLNATPSPVRASEILSSEEHSQHQLPSYLATGQQLIDQLLGGQGWVSGQVSEICGSSGTGKTQLCLTTLVPLLVRNKASRAIWIDTLDGGFSARRASDVVRTHIQQQQQQQQANENRQHEEVPSIEDQITSVLSRIQVYACRDVYDVINVVEVIRVNFEEVSALESFARIVVVDSLTPVLTGLLRGTDGVGHATMMHTARELRRLASDFNIVVLVTTSTVQLSNPEEKAPSILMTSHVKPSLGSSWRYATDLQLYLTRLNPDQHPGPESDPFGNDTRESRARVAEIMKSKRLKIAPMTSNGVQLRDSSSLIIAAPIPKSQVIPGKADYKILLLKRNRLGTSASAHVFPGGNVDDSDHDPRWETLLNYKPNTLNAPPLHNAICAIRESFEESGVLVTDPPTELSNDQLRIWRDRVHDNGQEFYNFCTTHNLKPAVHRLSHFSSWITPPVEAKRFRTQFYLTVLPWSSDSFSDSRVFADGKETTQLDWFTPEEAIEAYRTDHIQTFLPPQFVTLAHLLPIKRHEDLMEHFKQREIIDTMPEFRLDSQDDHGLHLSGILPGDEEHSSHVTQGHRHRILLTRTKKGMEVRQYVQGPTVVKARL
ncbi:hypothetical protein BGZ65_001625 [Modicella reniformis]|uniref:RecA family profile 1 domain-containing protein n=1 Tax=Modicella reniformis TaxID=1440133 RepID=A0A9P6SU57_9FUNG|nr:hypothetical protein BGZ65_001625 [Modicella reniformis]